MPFTFWTTNPRKLEEASAILGMDLQWYTPDDLAKIQKVYGWEIHEIQSMNIPEIVKKKAEDAYHALGKPVMVEDTGFFIEAHRGFPGPFIKYVVEWPGIGLLFQMMNGVADRRVKVITWVCMYDGVKHTTGYGVLEGIMPESPRGDKFGWSNAFEPIGTGKTFGEMTENEKNAMSMRRIALLDFMENLGNSEA